MRSALDVRIVNADDIKPGQIHQFSVFRLIDHVGSERDIVRFGPRDLSPEVQAQMLRNEIGMSGLAFEVLGCGECSCYPERSRLILISRIDRMRSGCAYEFPRLFKRALPDSTVQLL